MPESLVVDESAGLKDGASKYRITQSGNTWDLSKIDFEKLEEEFKCTPHKNIEIADLRAFIQKKLEQMLKENASRTDFATRLQGIIDRYNSGSSSADNYFNELMKFTKNLQAESERHILEGLTEEELELFDLIKKDKMTKDETQKVRLAAKSLLHRLREETPRVLIQDWFKDGQSRTRVRSAVETVLDENLPDTYDRAVFTEKCNNVFETMLSYASQGVKWTVLNRLGTFDLVISSPAWGGPATTVKIETPSGPIEVRDSESNIVILKAAMHISDAGEAIFVLPNSFFFRKDPKATLTVLPKLGLKKAITNTIEALNTGVHRLRDGTEIRRIPSRHQVNSSAIRQTLADIEKMLAELRARYDEHVRTGEIRPCGCSDPECPTFMVQPRAAHDMDRLREQILAAFTKIYPPFTVQFGWDFSR